jgi:hypothetical protein
MTFDALEASGAELTDDQLAGANGGLLAVFVAGIFVGAALGAAGMALILG